MNTVATATRTLPASSQRIAPEKFAHVVLKTANYDAVIAWYATVLQARVAFRNDFIAFLTYDDEHHRVAVLNTPGSPAQDSHPWERRAMVEVPDFLAGTIAVSGDFWHFSRTPAVVGSTPRVGEHNEEVLGNLLGYSKEEIAELYAKDVIGNSHYYDTL